MMGLPEKDILIVTFSRLIKSKRIELFLQAAAMMDKSLMERVTIVIGGEGPEKEKLELEARRLGIEDKVIFKGVIPHRDVVCFLKASDIFAATNELTNMSLPPCEAILCGVPVVAFDVSDTSEVVRDGETGLLVRNGDVAAFAKKLEELVRDDDLRKRLGRQAAEFGRGYSRSSTASFHRNVREREPERPASASTFSRKKEKTPRLLMRHLRIRGVSL
jgi:glycosyltransferase EpsD